MYLQVAHETLLLLRQTNLASSLLSSDSCDSLPGPGAMPNTRSVSAHASHHFTHFYFIHILTKKKTIFVKAQIF